MAIDRDSDATKHIVSSSPVLVPLTSGRQGLRNPTRCGWVFDPASMEGAHAYGGWWLNPDIGHVCRLCVHRTECTIGDCPHCAHIADCETSDPTSCDGCGRAASAPLPDATSFA
jgi:hypothetical protein